MKLDPKKTAVLTLDLQNGILAMGSDLESVLPKAALVTYFARQKHYRLIHVGLGFSEGHPEVSDLDSPFLKAKQNNLFVKGSPSSEFHPAVFQSHDLVVYKQRVSAFSENHLHMILRSQCIENLVLFGLSTSGIVLSTVTRAFDLDYKLTIIEDACADPDHELHKTLMEKVFAKRGLVLSAEAFIAEQERYEREGHV